MVKKNRVVPVVPGYSRPFRPSVSFPTTDVTADDEVVYGRPLHESLSESLRTGVSDPLLVSSSFDSYDDDGTSDYDLTAQYGYDRMERLQAAISTKSSAAVIQAAQAHASSPIPAAGPSPDPVTT